MSTLNSSAAGGDPKTREGAAEDLTPLPSSLFNLEVPPITTKPSFFLLVLSSKF